jgi:hypothetical protein
MILHNLADPLFNGWLVARCQVRQRLQRGV